MAKRNFQRKPISFKKKIKSKFNFIQNISAQNNNLKIQIHTPCSYKYIMLTHKKSSIRKNQHQFVITPLYKDELGYWFVRMIVSKV